MAKGFILKDAKGESAGFLQQMGSVLRCMARGDGGEARIAICFADGSGDEQTLALDGREHEWPCASGRAIACAYIARDDRLLLVTDDQARRAFESDRVRVRRRNEAEARPRQPERTEAGERAAEAKSDRANRADEAPARRETDSAPARARSREERPSGSAARTWPERRWPPPPCWPSARYVSGRWTDA